MDNLGALMGPGKKLDWGTPWDFYNYWDSIYGFTLDPCASPETAKCEKFFTEEDDGLAQSWQGHKAFVNPPFGRGIGDWVIKAYEESRGDCSVFMLLPARTDARWFRNVEKANWLHFVPGRLKFQGATSSAPFPVCCALFLKYGGSHRV